MKKILWLFVCILSVSVCFAYSGAEGVSYLYRFTSGGNNNYLQHYTLKDTGYFNFECNGLVLYANPTIKTNCDSKIMVAGILGMNLIPSTYSYIDAYTYNYGTPIIINNSLSYSTAIRITQKKESNLILTLRTPKNKVYDFYMLEGGWHLANVKYLFNDSNYNYYNVSTDRVAQTYALVLKK